MRDERDLSYLETHEWADIDGDSAYIGIDDFAQKEMGDIVYVNLPEVGDMVEAGEVFGDVESVKAVSDLFPGIRRGCFVDYPRLSAFYQHCPAAHRQKLFAKRHRIGLEVQIFRHVAA